ncbi:hypothetical protein LX32DRAFT_241976 [Colletotrichum zoysiae]|uniref:Uncharacterized protein n=1 Tax=Colletotrichum zoysiae TaxID=1216348 RepID=A0AAD9LX89_9PEZI|nr:hypothetical protein LX32DRAFT_241976 [Colletotrichum zoysiae]
MALLRSGPWSLSFLCIRQQLTKRVWETSVGLVTFCPLHNKPTKRSRNPSSTLHHQLPFLACRSKTHIGLHKSSSAALHTKPSRSHFSTLHHQPPGLPVEAELALDFTNRRPQPSFPTQTYHGMDVSINLPFGYGDVSLAGGLNGIIVQMATRAAFDKLLRYILPHKPIFVRRMRQVHSALGLPDIMRITSDVGDGMSDGFCVGGIVGLFSIGLVFFTLMLLSLCDPSVSVFDPFWASCPCLIIFWFSGILARLVVEGKLRQVQVKGNLFTATYYQR